MSSDEDFISLETDYLVNAFVEAVRLELNCIEDIISSGDSKRTSMDLLGFESLTDECFARLKSLKSVDT